MEASFTHSEMPKDVCVSSSDIENKLVAWIELMCYYNIFLNDDKILGKANRIQTRLNVTQLLS